LEIQFHSFFPSLNHPQNTENYEETKKRFVISISTLVIGKTRIEPKLTSNKPATKVDREALKRDVEEHPDAFHMRGLEL